MPVFQFLGGCLVSAFTVGAVIKHLAEESGRNEARKEEEEKGAKS